MNYIVDPKTWLAGLGLVQAVDPLLHPGTEIVSMTLRTQ
jgi:hypothetical protein